MNHYSDIPKVQNISAKNIARNDSFTSSYKGSRTLGGAFINSLNEPPSQPKLYYGGGGVGATASVNNSSLRPQPTASYQYMYAKSSSNEGDYHSQSSSIPRWQPIGSSSSYITNTN